jgi:hypothetical protein
MRTRGRRSRASPRRTKIICTIGPATNSQAAIRSLALAGMDVARLNFSYGSHAAHAETIRMLRSVADELGEPIGVLQDLSGPKLRVGELPGGGVRTGRANRRPAGLVRAETAGGRASGRRCGVGGRKGGGLQYGSGGFAPKRPDNG